MLPNLLKKYLVVLLTIGIFLCIQGKLLATSGTPPVQNNSQYTTPSGTSPSDGSSTETFSIHLQDTNNQPVASDAITVSSSNDGSATFPQNNQTTDSNGNATFTVASTTAGDTKITITDTTNNVVFTDWFTVTFYDSSKGCSNVPAAPVLTSVVSNSNNTATLAWTDSANPVSNYLVSYGVASKNYIYGNPNIGSQGTTSFTVGSLIGNKKYYFAVSANNNCGTSGFSNEVAAIVKPIPSTPAPTIEPTDAPIATVIPVADTSVTDTPTDTPQDTSTPVTSVQNTNTTFRNIGIGVIAAGIMVIALVFIFQKTKKKNQIPPLSPPIIQPPTIPPQTVLP